MPKRNRRLAAKGRKPASRPGGSRWRDLALPAGLGVFAALVLVVVWAVVLPQGSVPRAARAALAGDLGTLSEGAKEGDTHTFFGPT